MALVKGWSSLPDELKLEIINSIPREDLKNFRYLHRASLGVITSALFRTIHLSPNCFSFDRANQVALHQIYAHYVKELVYHVGTLDTTFVDNFPLFVQDINAQIHPIRSRELTEGHACELYQNYLDEVQAQKNFLLQGELDLLVLLISRFPSLECVVSQLDSPSTLEDPEGYIENRTWMSTQIDEEPHSDRLLQAIWYRRLKIAQLDVLGWRIIQSPNVVWSDSSSLPHHLTSLRLGLSNWEFVELKDDRVVSSFSNLLRASENSLKFLSLEFDELPFDSTVDDSLQTISSCIFERHWSRLRGLSLGGLVAHESDFVRFLHAHSATLHSLRLADTEIMNNVGPHNNIVHFSEPGSVVSFFYRIHDLISPQHVRLAGNFTNRYTEAWYAPEYKVHLTDSLCNRWEKFLEHRGPSPFPPLEEYMRLQQSRYELKIVSFEFRNGIEVVPTHPEWSDDSWEWSPELLE